jgi:hypothetical protein
MLTRNGSFSSSRSHRRFLFIRCGIVVLVFIAIYLAASSRTSDHAVG